MTKLSDTDQQVNFDLMIHELHYNEIESVVVRFGGSNDSGDLYVDEILMVDKEASTPTDLLDTIIVKGARMPDQYDYSPGSFARKRDWNAKPPTLKELINHVCLEELELTHGGWEINDGSHGTITITPLADLLKTKNFIVDFNYNEPDYDDDYDSESEEYNDE
ncbi:hypothetical protein EBZ39_00310 [bacterium]|nr:hypothetical protein [bacterium]